MRRNPDNLRNRRNRNYSSNDNSDFNRDFNNSFTKGSRKTKFRNYSRTQDELKPFNKPDWGR